MLILAAAWAHECAEVDVASLAETPAPAVFVLGERHGERADMKLALSLVRALQRRGPVTLAMEAVHERNQPVIDQFAMGQVKPGKLPAALDWDETWGYPYGAYKKLVTGSRSGIAVVAAGLELGPKPEDREVPMPEGYAEKLMKSMEGHAHLMTPEVRERFPVSMTWRDFRIGELGVQSWSQQGYLVVLAGRGHVEGGQGTNWQLERLQEHPVHSVVLAHEGSRCEPGDRILVK